MSLYEAIDKMPSQLPGHAQRISLARTIVVDPVIMLYDEPTTGLDPVTSDEISVLINDSRKNTNLVHHYHARYRLRPRDADA